MGEVVGTILGIALGSVGGFFLVASFLLAYFIPLILFLAMRHLRGIRHELKRMNDRAESAGPVATGGVLGI